MNIAQVCPYDYTYPGGVVSHISHLRQYLVREGHNVSIIAPCTKGREPYLQEDVVRMGRPLPIPNGGSIARVALSPHLLRSVDDVLEAGAFDIVHIHEPFCPTVALACLLRSKSTNVGTFHAFHRKPRGYWLFRPILRHWLPRLHGKIAVSPPAKEFVSRHLPGSYAVIPNGIDLERFCKGVQPLEEYRDGKFNILFVGRLEKRKGFHCLLKAYAQVKKQVGEARLIIVGPGTRLRKKYESLLQSEQLRDVVFAGYVSQDELPRYYATADLFCAPATGEESFGIILLEAMASGKPIVASRIAGYASVLDDQVQGILVPPKDDCAVADAIVRLVRDPGACERMGARGREKAQEFGWDRVSRRVMDYYDTVLNERSGKGK